MANYRYRQLTQVGPGKVPIVTPVRAPLPGMNQPVAEAGAVYEVTANSEREASFEALVAMLEQGQLSASRDLVFADGGWRSFEVVAEFAEAARRGTAKERRRRLAVAAVLLLGAALVGGGGLMLYVWSRRY